MYPEKINIGCGFDKRPGYLNIDSDPACEPDVLIVDNDLSALPQSYFEEAIALDVLEHIPRRFTMGALFDWVRLLKPGGRLFVETSYIFGIIDVMRRNDSFETQHNWKMCLFGNQVHPGDWHFNGFTKKTLRTYLTAAGLQVENLDIREDWLIFGWSIRTETWDALLSMEDYPAFVREAHEQLLRREPEDWKLQRPPTLANSPGRLAEIKALVGSEERLYRIGRELDAVGD